MAKTADDIVAAIKQLGKEIKESQPEPIADRKEQAKMTREDSIKLGEERKKLLEAEMKLEEDLQKRITKKIELLKNEIELNKLSSDSVDDKAKKQRRYERALDRLTKSQKKNTEAQEANEQAVDGVMGSLQVLTGVSNDFSKSLIGQTVAILKSSKAQKKLQKDLDKTYTKGRVAASIFEKLGQGAVFFGTKGIMEVQSGLADFNKSGGMLARFGSNIASQSAELRNLGVTAGDVGASLNALGQAYPLKQLGDDAAGIAANFAKFEKFGVSVQTSAENFTTLTRSLGQTKEEAAKTVEQVAKLGIELGMGAGALSDDFKAALPRLSIYGNNAVKVFKNIASASTRLGLSVSDVVDLAEGFQTFEGSAKAAGQLNAILGGGFIDNLELMQASFEDPVKAAGMIKDAFANAGKDVTAMGPAALKASAQAAGFSDVNKFRKFLQGDISAEEARKDDAAAAAMDTNTIASNSLTIQGKILSAIQGGVNKLLSDLLKMFGGPEGIMTALSSIPPAALGGGAIAASTLGPALLGFAAKKGGVGMLKGGGKLLGAAKGLFSGSKSAAKIVPEASKFTNFAKVPKGAEKLASPLIKSTASTAAKKGLGKGLGKTLLKKIPGIGALMSVGFMASRIMDGDILGAGMELTSGLASTVPGIGTAASLGIDAALMARDMNTPQVNSSMPSKKPTTSSGTVSQGSREVKHVIEIVQNTPQAEQFVTAIYRKDLSSNAIG